MDKWYCPLPFRHAYIDPDGISCCCKTPRQSSTLSEWPDNQWLKQIQTKFLNNEIPQECRECQQSEQDFGHSLRTNSVRDYGNEIFTDTKIDFVDYRSVNICNFKCRSCAPVFSHGIDQEVKNNPSLLKFWKPNQTKTVSVDSINRDWLLENLSQIRRLMFTGGEPTRIREIREILETIIERDEKNIEILITTNGSFEDQFWKDLTLRIPRLHWTLSLDAVGPAAEIIRHGTVWSIVEKNARWLSQNAHSLDINTVVSELSVPGLPDLIKFVRDLQRSTTKQNGCLHQFHVCRKPDRLAADNWPDDLRPKILSQISKCLDMDLLDYQRDFVQNLISVISQSSFDQNLWDRSRQFHSVLDSVRHEDHMTLLSI